MDDSAIMYDEIIEAYTKLSPKDDKEETNFNQNKAACKTQSFYILLEFLLISIGLFVVVSIYCTIALFIAVSIYCYMIKYQAKQKYLLPLNFTNNKLKEVIH